MTESTENLIGVEANPADIGEHLGTYSEMFSDYLSEQPWARASEHMLFVFHVRKVCEQLDSGGLEKAAMSGAYLNAITKLEARRPGARRDPAGDNGSGEQSSIFDFMD